MPLAAAGPAVFTVLIDDTDAGDRHLSRETLARLLSGQAAPEEIRRDLLPHIRCRCPQCRDALDDLRRLGRLFGHWDVRHAELEWAEAHELVRRLDALPQRDRLRAVELEEYHTWGVCRLLQVTSRDLAHLQPERAARLAYMAVRVSRQLGAAYDPPWVRGLQALCLAALGNARRHLGELAAAGDALDGARALLLGAGVGSPAFEAEVMLLEGLLQRDRHRLPEALQCFEGAFAVYAGTDAEAADSHQAGRALAQQAWCHYHASQPDRALELLAEASGRIDSGSDPRLAAQVAHGRVWSALLAGSLDTAQALVPPAVELADRACEAAIRLRLARAEARIAVARGQMRAAEEDLRRLVRGFLELDEGIDATLAIFDLSDLLVRGNDAEAVHDLASEILPAFGARDLGRTDFAALHLFQKACEANLFVSDPWSCVTDAAPRLGEIGLPSHRLTPGLIRELAKMIEAHRRPSLDWWSGWGAQLTRETTNDEPALD
jgi:hypothetical protein